MKSGKTVSVFVMRGPQLPHLALDYSRPSRRQCNTYKHTFTCVTPQITLVTLWDSLQLYLLLLLLQLLEFDKELSVYKERLHELEISFPPRYGTKYKCFNDINPVYMCVCNLNTVHHASNYYYIKVYKFHYFCFVSFVIQFSFVYIV